MPDRWRHSREGLYLTLVVVSALLVLTCAGQWLPHTRSSEHRCHFCYSGQVLFPQQDTRVSVSPPAFYFWLRPSEPVTRDLGPILVSEPSRAPPA